MTDAWMISRLFRKESEAYQMARQSFASTISAEITQFTHKPSTQRKSDTFEDNILPRKVLVCVSLNTAQHAEQLRNLGLKRFGHFGVLTVQPFGNIGMHVDLSQA
eukprot:1749955-Amphidinium_carterae.1